MLEHATNFGRQAVAVSRWSNATTGSADCRRARSANVSFIGALAPIIDQDANTP